MAKYTECNSISVKVGKGKSKKALEYKNTRTNQSHRLKVGKRGGLWYPTKNKKPRYVRSACKKTKCSKGFWGEVDRLTKQKKTEMAVMRQARQTRKR